MASKIQTAPAAAPKPEKAKPPAQGALGLSGGITPYLFMTPYLIFFVTFVLAPAVFGLWMSLHEYDFLLPNKPFVGLSNYTELFTPDSTTAEPFWDSMQATGIFVLFSVPLLMVLPLLIALVLNQRFPGRTFFRAVYFAPYVLGVAVISLLWRFLLDPNVGFVNYVLGVVGLPDRTPWTTALPWAWVTLVGVTVWWTLGFNAVIYLAGLQDISRDLYEAASVDGASKWDKFWNITIPGLRRVLLFVLLVTILASANLFGQSYLITQGAPGEETTSAVMFIAEEGLRRYRMGNAAAMSLILTAILALASAAIFRLSRRWED